MFRELVSLPELIAHPNFTLTIALTREDEIQKRGRGGSWRRKGWMITDRVLLDVVETVVFERPADFLRFLPPDLPSLFTSSDLARCGRYPQALAGQIAYCLRRMGAIEAVGRRRSAILYAIPEAVETPRQGVSTAP